VTQENLWKASFHHITPLLRNLQRFSAVTGTESKSSYALPSEPFLNTSWDRPSAPARPLVMDPKQCHLWASEQGLLSWNVLPSFSINALYAWRDSSGFSPSMPFYRIARKSNWYSGEYFGTVLCVHIIEITYKIYTCKIYILNCHLHPLWYLAHVWRINMNYIQEFILQYLIFREIWHQSLQKPTALQRYIIDF